MKYLKKTRIMAENIAITATVIVAVCIFVVSFVPIGGLQDVMYSALEMNRIVQRVFAVAMIVTTVNLYKRKRVAWLITVCGLIVNLIQHMHHVNYWLIVVFLVCEAILLFVFLLTWQDFCCPSDKHSVKTSVLLGGVSLIGVLINMGIGYYMFHNQQGLGQGASLLDSIGYAFAELFSFGPETKGVPYRGMHFEVFTFWFSWICIILAVVFIVKPFISQGVTTKKELEHARSLVNRYGQNPGAYLTLEDDKTLYFGKKVEGVIAYGVVGETIVINGDPTCADEDFAVLLDEFTEFAVKSAHNLFFLSVTDKYLNEYKKQGYGYVKCGEEARFDLQNYDIAGKKGAKMRANVNHATKAGLTVCEYPVAKQRDQQLDQEFDRISQEWLGEKSSSQLAFTLGGVGLEEPLDKRYFYAVDDDGKMQGFVVFCPFGGDQSGYMADVTRRAKDAPGGVMEKIMYEAFMTFKEEGEKWGSMGLAPLVNLTEEGATPTPVERLLTFIYDNLNNIYGFKNLYRAKEKYSPSSWEPGYFVYMPKVPTPQMIYAVIRIQNPQGMMDYVKAFFKGNPEKKLKKEAKEVAKQI